MSYALVGDGVEVTLPWWPKEPGTYLIPGLHLERVPRSKIDKWESYIEPLELVVW